MSLTIYNTLTRKKEKFEPRDAGKISMYTCGPTVYDYFHIGNARSFVTSDVIRRYFEYKGYDVTLIMNVTDIEDKIINRAREEGIDAGALAQRFIYAFMEDIAKLGIKPATKYPKATDTIKEMIDHIQGLIGNRSAYVVDGDVYFRVEKFPAYGKLSGKKVEELMVGARVDEDIRKENPVDFALWKNAKPGEPSWDSPWGKGRPGWHIECSVMSRMHLGDSFDIHAGGNDLIFPHHENEIAQSEALYKKPFVRYWMHFGFLNIDDEKMSKSMGNFFTLREILGKYRATTLRFFYLQTHYRGPLNFTEEGLNAAEKGLQKIMNLLSTLETMQAGTVRFDTEPYRKRFEEAMDDDLNTPMGFGVLFELIRDVNVEVRKDERFDPDSLSSLKLFLQQTCGEVFGILRTGSDQLRDSLLHDVMNVVLAARAKARAEKQWTLADFIRDELGKVGITVEDGKHGSTWKIHD